MKRTCFLLGAALICQAALAQTQPGATAFQQADSLAAGGRGGRGINVVPIPRAETGRPFSAVATTQTTQTLPDGIHVSQTTTMVQYRDADGRVRTEASEPGASNSDPVKRIVIRDPVAGVTYTLDPSTKTARKQVAMPPPGFPAVLGGRRGGRGDSTSASNSDALAQMQQRLGDLQDMAAAMRAAKNPNLIEEDLGMKTVNGVAAHGTRITNIVPVGAIGNDKEFRSVTERWLSPDLNLLIKSVSTDPRFGTTTYELTNISRQAPDASLFQVPADYNIPNTRQ